ncbi:MAG: hypothetical protein NTW29_19630 [Bacteroidetes bacterium]|nr:hypothetical protein [Bacteroidota bacterium]
MRTLLLTGLCLLGSMALLAQSSASHQRSGSPESGNVGIGTLHPNSFKLEVAGNVGPEADTSRDLGAPTKRWSALYANKIHASLYPTDFVKGGLVFPDSTGKLIQNPSMLNWNDHSARLSIGVSQVPDGYSLAVKGGIIAEKLKLKLLASGWPDYVFHTTYRLPSLKEVASYIQQYSHLPHIPSAQEMEKEGLDVSKLTSLLLQKIEELTLYLIRMDQEMKQLKKAINTIIIR